LVDRLTTLFESVFLLLLQRKRMGVGGVGNRVLGGFPWRLSAISRALIVMCRSFTALTAHPTMNRENRSRMAAR
jgi:hypothetical protein